MKRLVLLLAVVALSSPGNLWADEQSGGAAGGVIVINAGAGGAPNLGGPWGAVKSAAAWYIESIDKIVGLSDAQKKTITDIIEARDKLMKDWQTQNAEKLKAASNALMEAFGVTADQVSIQMIDQKAENIARGGILLPDRQKS